MKLVKEKLKYACRLIVLLEVCLNVLLYAQDSIGGKAIKRGIWKDQTIDYVSGQIAVFLKPGVSQSDFAPLLINSSLLTITRNFDTHGVGVLEAPDSVDIFTIIDALSQSSLLRAVEPIGITHAHSYPNDPDYLNGMQWGLSRIDAPSAWEITKGDSAIKVAILDSGIPLNDSTHLLSHSDLDLAVKILLGPDFTGEQDSTTVRDANGHGTHVAGITGAETDNNEGIAGVAPNCKLYIVQVFNFHGQGRDEWFYDGVIHAVDNGAKIINYSGGGPTQSTFFTDALDYARAHNVLVVVSAGNDSGQRHTYPAEYEPSYSNLIAVGATDSNDVKPVYSNTGSWLDVVAPGGSGQPGANNIWSTIPNYYSTRWPDGSDEHKYNYLAGTSMAAPHVAGVAALILSEYPGLTPSQVRDTLRRYADDVNKMSSPGKDDSTGYGRINAYRALTGAPSSPRIPTPTDGAIVGCSTVALSWDTADGDPTSYHLQISLTADFSQTLLDSAGLTNAHFVPNQIFCGWTYYWRVSATNTRATGNWSKTWSFTAVPSTPTLESPANGAVEQSLSPTLSWNDVEEASSYHLQVSTDSGFTSFNVNDSTLTNTSKQIGPLATNTIYYWRVHAKANVETSPWSTRRYFTTKVVAPPVLSCYDCAVGHHPAMTWSKTADSGGTYRMFRAQCPQTDPTCGGEMVWRGMTGWSSDSTYTDYAVTITGKVMDGSVYHYHVQARDQAAVHYSDYSNQIDVNSEDGWITKTVANQPRDEQPVIPTEFALFQNYPNGFNPTTEIRYALLSDVHVKLEVYDMLGRLIATLVDGEQSAGYKTVEFNAANISSGIYLYRLTAGDFTAMKKMVIVK